LKHAEAPNQVWCADFKGWFLTQDGVRCDPLTITDAHSRYLLRCCAVKKTDGQHAWPCSRPPFASLDYRKRFRTDNGSPFASRAPAGHEASYRCCGCDWESAMSGSNRGKPQQNGRHERMHQTLKQETANPPERNLRRQQMAFLHFQQEYNQERPHEALDYATPASRYAGSERRYPERLPELEYPEGRTCAECRINGDVKLNGVQMFGSSLLAWEVSGWWS